MSSNDYVLDSAADMPYEGDVETAMVTDFGGGGDVGYGGGDVGYGGGGEWGGRGRGGGWRGGRGRHGGGGGGRGGCRCRHCHRKFNFMMIVIIVLLLFIVSMLALLGKKMKFF